MKDQLTFSDYEYSKRKRKTRKAELLEMMDEIIPWDEWCAIVEPYYPSGKRGRPPRGVETMLRMYLLQNWYNLSDEKVEDEIYDSYSFKSFMGLNFIEDEQVPDATTLCKFRKLLNENGITKLFMDVTNRFFNENGKIMHGGTIVDATIIDAPKSTKNANGERDPEMHQTQKGNQWYFGAKLHAGVDAGTGYIHTIDMTAANVADITVAKDLIREDDEVVYGDAGYTGIEKRNEIKENEHLSSIDYRTNSQKPYRKNKWSAGSGMFWFKRFEYQKSRVRSKVEYAFFVIKQIFGYRKVRYRGIAKNKTQAYVLCASANFYMLGKSGMLRSDC